MRPLRRLALLLLPLTAVAAGACRGQEATAHHAAPAAGIDWSQVTSRDLDIAAVFRVARDQGVRAALDSLSTLAAADPSLEPLGHQVAHGLGRYAIAQRNYDAAVFAECRPTFFSGCYHGVLEGWLAGHPGADAAAARGLCASAAMAALPPYAFRECAHGLGHGLTSLHGDDPLAALPDCDATFPGELARRECYDGVFMENVVKAMGTVAFDVHDARSGHAHAQARTIRPLPKAGDPTFPCDSVDADQGPSCWAYQPVVLFAALDGDLSRIARTCDAAPAESAGACWRGIGKQTLGRMPARADSVARVCATTVHAADCVGGMVEFYVDQAWKVDSAMAFCASAPGALRDACYRAVGERVAWIDPAPAAIRAACAPAAAHAPACISAAEAERVADVLPRPIAPASAPPTPRPAAAPSPAPHHPHASP